MAKKKATKKKATKKTTKKKASKKSNEMLIVTSKTKDALRSHGLNVSSDAIDALNEKVHELVVEAAKRAEANKRGTIRPWDFIV